MTVLLNRVARLALLLSFTFGISVPHQAFANVGEAFGFGSRTMALGGAGVALTSDPSAAYHNPAGLGANYSDERFQFSFGMMYVQPSFKAITNVVTQNTYVADTLRISDVD